MNIAEMYNPRYEDIKIRDVIKIIGKHNNIDPNKEYSVIRAVKCMSDCRVCNHNHISIWITAENGCTYITCGSRLTNANGVVYV